MTAQTILPANTLSSGYDVDNSLRFDDGSSDYLSRTVGAGNRQTWTYSVWVKRSTLGTDQCLFDTYVHGNDNFRTNFADTDKVSMRFYNGTEFQLGTARRFRDTNAWYHIVFVADTTNGTEADRFRIYVNGVRETNLSDIAYPTQNLQMSINDSNTFQIGRRQSTNYFDGYMAEVVLIDGQALDATSFGEFDEDTGIWKPIDVSGLTFGTNGFHLDFEDSSSLGNDAVGSNNFSVGNLTSVDQSTDTCTNNYITMNPNNATLGSVTLSEGNLKASLNGNYQVFGTINLTSGKWYWEQKINGSSLFVSVADGNRATVNTGTGLLNRDYAWAYRSDGVKQHENTTSSYGDSFTTNDIIGVALDMDNGFIYFSKNGTFQNSGDPTSGATGTGAAYSSLHTDAAAPDGLTPCLGQYGGDQITSWNFGSPSYSISSGNADANGYGNFEYAVPSGYYAINTKNLAEYG